MKHVILQAHRGVSTEYPENTMSAFRGAVYQGYELIELDPEVTADGRIVVLHDATLNRTGRNADGTKIEGELPLRELTYEQALEFDFGCWFSAKFKGEKIPLLSQVLELAGENETGIKIDNKFQRFPEKDRKTLYRLVKESDAEVGFTCSELKFVREVREALPEAAIHYDGPVSEEILKELAGLTDRDKLVVWLPYRSEYTSWVQVDFADEKLCSLVKQYACLGIWILHRYDQLEDAAERFGADVAETTGSLKPVKRKGFRADMHMHSEHSHDSTTPVEALCKSAGEKGLDAICITDHCDIYRWSDLGYMEASASDIQRCKENFKGQPEVLKGVELGEANWESLKELAGKAVELVDYDAVIGSVHVIRYSDPVEAYSRTDFSGFSEEEIDEYLRIYFEDLLKTAQTTDLDILAHLTTPLKYINGKYGRNADWHKCSHIIEEILSCIIRKGIALEINSSCKGTAFDEFMPDEEIVDMYAKMGGYLVTMGADAHTPENVFRYGEQVTEMLRKYGFKNMFYLKNRYFYQYNIEE